MKILVKINQAECVRRGIDCPSSTAHIDINPAVDLTQVQRDYVADLLRDGHELTHVRELACVGATPEALAAAIDEQLAAAAAKRAEKEAHLEKRHHEVTAAIQDARAAPPVSETWETWNGARNVTVTAELPRRPFRPSDYAQLRPETQAILQEAIAEADAAREPLKKAAEAAAVERAEEAQRARDARAAAEKAEYDELFGRLPEKLRARAREGVASEDEVMSGIRRLIRVDAGYSGEPRHTSGTAKLDVISDAEYDQLAAARAAAPDEATVTASLAWSGTRGWRPAEDDEWEEADKDGEVFDEGENVERGILIELPKRGGVTATVWQPFTNS